MEQTDEVAIDVLGRFRIVRAGVEIRVASERASQLIMLLAAKGGTVPVEVALEALWPGAEPTVGRRRLKNVMSRARVELGSNLIRDRLHIGLSDQTRIDLVDFEAAARHCLFLAHTDPVAASNAATDALNLYSGELLPENRYDDWAAEARATQQRRALSLIDILFSTPEVIASPERVAAATQTLARINPADRQRLLTLETKCEQAGNHSSARALRRHLGLTSERQSM